MLHLQNVISHPALYSVFPLAASGNWSMQLSKCENARSDCYVNAKVEYHLNNPGEPLA